MNLHLICPYYTKFNQIGAGADAAAGQRSALCGEDRALRISSVN